MGDALRGRRALFGLLFLLSGAAGLIYEQLWIRELQHFFGSTIHSITTVVAAYMGGLGLGAWFGGKRADESRNPAAWYGLLELAIGVFGILSPLVFRGVGASYLALARAVEPGLWLATALKFVFAFAVMLVPTFLMGATLPILTRAFAGLQAAHLRRELALFYGLNTVGGVLGCALGGYYLVEYVGTTTSLLGCGLLNLALGAIAVAATRLPATAPSALVIEPEPESVLVEGDPELRRLAIRLIGLTAFASLLYEIAWTRVLVLLVGSSTYAFTTILVCFLLGLGLGSLLAIGKGRGIRELVIRAALIQGAIAALAALLFPFFRALPVYIISTLQVPFLSPVELILLQSLALAVVIIPPAVGMGMAFPILTELASSRAATSGGQTGRAYFANTIGSIAGAVVTGFLLIHTIGSERTLMIGVAVNVVAVALLTRRLHRDGQRGLAPGERAPLLLAVLALVIALLTPSWSGRLLDRGPAIYGRDMRTRHDLDHFLRGYGGEQVVFDEGWNAAISVWRNGGTVWLKSNGKADASTIADMNTQALLGLLPMLAHPHPSRAFIIGFGSGTTVRAVADVPGMRQIDVAEIERAVLRAAPHFAVVNGNVLADPRVRVIEDDARSALQLAGEPYDVIASEPSNPWVAGVASLYTPEYFRIARSRLADDGVFVQWVQTYRVPVAVVAVVVANLRSVFPHVEMWYSNTADLMLVAANHPIQWNHDRFTALFQPGSATAQSMYDWLEAVRPSDLLGRFIMGDRGTEALARSATFTHRDNRPSLEFVAARSLLATGLGSVFDSMMAMRNAAGDTLPALTGWRLARGEWLSAYARSLPTEGRLAQAFAEQALAAAPDDPERHGDLGVVLFNRNDPRAALTHLQAALRGLPTNAHYLLHAALATNALGDRAGARALFERARAAGGDSIQATSMLGEIAADEGDWQRAAHETSRALRGLRPTLATPFPASLQNNLRKLAEHAPPFVAAPVMEEAVRLRPAWDMSYWAGAMTNLRWGGTHCRRAAELVDELTRFGWTDREKVELLRRCRTG